MKRIHLVCLLALTLIIGSLSISCQQEKKQTAREEVKSTQTQEEAVETELDSLIMVQITDAMQTIGATFNAVRFYKNDNNKFPVSFEELEEQEYLCADSTTKCMWDFSLILEEQNLTLIKAVSTEQMKGGAGKVVLYDVNTNNFTGYGLPDKAE
ncbi:MAG: hypothetical protein HQ568_08760 [Calditrichaeota bacterium]|nr:hypothetical protein [Calditrichota bacterium]